MPQQNLYWRRSEAQKTVNIVETPFASEEAFEKYIFENSDLLEDMYLIKRQVRTGQRQGIPDIIGVDQDSNICIVEMKNTVVGEEILPQLLQYAIWAETNPDSVKALWLEDESRPPEAEVSWDNPNVRVLVIAPAFRPSLLRMSGKINYQVDLLEVKRFVVDEEEFVLITKMEPEPEKRPRLTRGLQVYDQAFYEQSHGKEAVRQFMDITQEIEDLASDKRWGLQRKFNKYYVGFKYGNKLCFGVGWAGTNTWNLVLKVPEPVAKGVHTKHWEFQRYEQEWNQALIRCLDPGKAKAAELEELFEAAYRNIAGV